MIDISQLKEVASLEGISEDALAHLAKVMQKRAYRDADPIFNENTEGGDLYLIGAGSVRLNRRAKEGEAQNLAIVKEGDFLGIMTFMVGGKHSASAVAKGDCTLYVMDRNSFDEFTEKFPTDANNVAATTPPATQRTVPLNDTIPAATKHRKAGNESKT